jgi:2-dehydropantoate 2-reductase
MRILVYGAGVVGSVLAARLQASGQEVSLLARGQRLADLRQRGILLEDALTGRQSVTQVPVVERLEPGDTYDWAVVVMRRNQVSAVLPCLAAAARVHNVLFVGNNAAGPGEMIAALGAARVVLGFASVAGTRRGPLLRVLVRADHRPPVVTLGELDGSQTPRLAELCAVLEAAGFRVRYSTHMDAWLKTHAALVSPLANALYLAGGDNYRLARTRDGLVLAVRAVREGLRVLKARQIPIEPPMLRLWASLPEPILVALVQRLLNTELAEIALAGHVNAARDEMQCLADEFCGLAAGTSILTPAMDRLHAYVDAAVPPMPEGSAAIGINWRGVWAAIGLAIGLLAVAIWGLTRLGIRRRASRA